MKAIAAFVLALALALPCEAQAPLRDVTPGARVFALPGPEAGSTRHVIVWRPADARRRGELPTLYMADGPLGAYVALSWLRPAIESGAAPPIMVVGLEPSREWRALEYVKGLSGGARAYRAHEQWFLQTVLPWAERTQGAARDRSRRAVGGYSNGADFAAEMVASHPEFFAGALIHSPYHFSVADVAADVSRTRWAISGGDAERGGTVGRQAARALLRRGALVRRCFGRWGHEFDAWRDLSPGSILWILSPPQYAVAETQRERAACRTPSQ